MEELTKKFIEFLHRQREKYCLYVDDMENADVIIVDGDICISDLQVFLTSVQIGPATKDGDCYYCGEKTNSLTGNPNKWCVFLCYEDEPGKVKHHHIGCVMQRLNDFEKLKELHKMQAELSHNDVAFWGSDYNDKNEFIGIKFYIICNDVFAWGTADAEPVEDDELKFVYDIYEKYKEVGIDAWCSLKRNKLNPQKPYLDKYKDFHKVRDEIEKMIKL